MEDIYKGYGTMREQDTRFYKKYLLKPKTLRSLIRDEDMRNSKSNGYSLPITPLTWALPPTMGTQEPNEPPKKPPTSTDSRRARPEE
jgi:hypothetical protein